MIDPQSTAPNKEGIKDCCKIPGNLNWKNFCNDEGQELPDRYVGVCKTCGCRHFVLRVTDFGR